MAKLARRCEAGPGELAGQPMFCVETAVKCLYWSTLVYDYREVLGSVPAWVLLYGCGWGRAAARFARAWRRDGIGGSRGSSSL